MTRNARLWAPGVALMLLGAIGFFGILDWVQEGEDLQRLDEPLLEWLAAHRVPWLTSVMTFVTWVFGPVILPILVAVGAFIWGRRTRQWFEAAVVVGAMAFSGLLSVILKVAVARPRPSDSFWQIPDAVSSFSFPSGHTIGAATLVMTTGYLAWRGERHKRVLVAWALATVATILIVGGSRLYLGYHFLTDVLAGVCVAVFTLGVVTVVDRWWTARARRREPGREPDAAAQPSASV